MLAVAAAAGAAACGVVVARLADDIVIAAAARAIAHPMRFILTPKNGLQDGPLRKRAREIGGLIGVGSPALKGVEPALTSA